MMKIRLAKIQDLESICNIYNYAIGTRCATGDTIPLDISYFERWLRTHIPDKIPIFVAELDGRVVGYNALSYYRAEKPAFCFLRETSYYVDPDCFRQGIASKLLNHVTEDCRKKGIKNLITFVMAHNQASIAFLEKHKFQQWARLPQVAEIDGAEYDHVIYGYRVTD
jgi:L-amino acid N-acyltransferase YncA